MDSHPPLPGLQLRPRSLKVDGRQPRLPLPLFDFSPNSLNEEQACPLPLLVRGALYFRFSVFGFRFRFSVSVFDFDFRFRFSFGHRFAHDVSVLAGVLREGIFSGHDFLLFPPHSSVSRGQVGGVLGQFRVMTPFAIPTPRFRLWFSVLWPPTKHSPYTVVVHAHIAAGCGHRRHNAATSSLICYARCRRQGAISLATLRAESEKGKRGKRDESFPRPFWLQVRAYRGYVSYGCYQQC